VECFTPKYGIAFAETQDGDDNDDVLPLLYFHY